MGYDSYLSFRNVRGRGLLTLPVSSSVALGVTEPAPILSSVKGKMIISLLTYCRVVRTKNKVECKVLNVSRTY